MQEEIGSAGAIAGAIWDALNAGANSKIEVLVCDQTMEGYFMSLPNGQPQPVTAAHARTGARAGTRTRAGANARADSP